MASLEGSSSSSSPSSIEQPQVTTNDYYSVEKALRSLQQTNPWIEQALQQIQLAQKTAEQTLDSAITATGVRLSRVLSTASAHSQQTLESLKDVKAKYEEYEAQFFGKVKEGTLVAVSHPFLSTGAVVGVGALAMKGPRKFLYYRTLRWLSSDEALVSRADAKAKELKQSFERLKAEAEKLEKRALQAEEEMKRGITKLRNAGNQIRKALLSADKIENQARGLNGVLADLPKPHDSHFRAEVSNLVTEAKWERKSLSKELKKISNYGISV